MLEDELIKLHESDEYPLHMPGHKRQPIGSGLDGAYGIDITEIPGYDNLYDARGIIREAMDYASKLYDCPHTYYLVNGSTVGILTAIHTAAAMYEDPDNVASVCKRDTLLVADNCHRSVKAGADLAGLKTEYIEVTRDLHFKDHGSEKPVAASYRIRGAASALYIHKRLQTALSEGTRFAAVVITSPTYEGIISDVSAIAEVCHEFDTMLIVDEAHGAHFDLCPEYPNGALKNGADIVIHSTHKTLAAMTQTALLHAQGDMVDITKLEKYWSILQTSSPSYVLMSSIDTALHHITSHPEMVKEHLMRIDVLKDKLAGLKNLHLLTQSDLTDDPSITGLDTYKLTVFSCDPSVNGHILQQILLKDHHIQTELAEDDHIIAITTYMDTDEGLNRFTEALLEIDDRMNDGYYNDIKGADVKNSELYAPCIPSAK